MEMQGVHSINAAEWAKTHVAVAMIGVTEAAPIPFMQDLRSICKYLISLLELVGASWAGMMITPVTSGMPYAAHEWETAVEHGDDKLIHLMLILVVHLQGKLGAERCLLCLSCLE